MKRRRTMPFGHTLAAVCFLATVFNVGAQKFPEVKDLPVRKEMPDVMTMWEGTKVTTPEQWRKRREEMKRILEFYELGRCPPAPGNVSGEELQSQTVRDGAVKYRL